MRRHGGALCGSVTLFFVFCVFCGHVEAPSSHPPYCIGPMMNLFIHSHSLPTWSSVITALPPTKKVSKTTSRLLLPPTRVCTVTSRRYGDAEPHSGHA